MIYYYLLFLLLAAGSITWFVWFLFHKAWQGGLIFSSLNFILLEARFPRILETIDRQQELSALASMEQFYNTLDSVLKKNKGFFQPRPSIIFEIAVSEQNDHIVFYTAVPRWLQKTVERQIQGFFPQAELEWVNDYNIFARPGAFAGSILKLEKSYVLPFETYKTLATNTLAIVTNSVSLISERGEGAAIQILVKPTHFTAKHDARKVIKALTLGRSFGDAVKELSGPVAFLETLDWIFNTLGFKKERKEPPPVNPALSPEAQEIIKAVETKTRQNLFEVNVRILASARTIDRAEEILTNAENAFSQFQSPNLNDFYALRIYGKKLKKLAYNFSFRLFNENEKVMLSAEELTSIFHWPIVRLETPKIKLLKSKQAPPPAIMPSRGVILGKNQYRGLETVIRIDTADRRRHLYIIGQTGTGKTSIMKSMIKQDIEAGNGVCVIDPHGDLVESVLGFVPENRAQDVILFDPADAEWPIGLNLLEAATPQEKDFAIQEMIAIFYKLFPPETMGPVFEHNMRNAMLTLMADEMNPGTLIDIPRIFTDRTFASSLLIKVTDPLVRDFWEKEMSKMTEQYKSEMLGYLISKVGRFVENTMMRNIIGQPHSGINFSEIMDNGKILLVNLSKGRLGEMNSTLLGLIIVTKLQMAAFKRATERNEETRRDFYLYMDEFQNFTTDSISSILSEARKFRLNLIMGHQFIAQMPEKIRDAVFGNVGSMVTFRVGADDAPFVVKQFAPIFTEADLINIDNFHAYVRLLVNGATTLPFNIKIEAPPPSSAEAAERIRNLSRQKYAKPRAAVEEVINKRFGK